jgi:uncharacterized membrane protein
MEIQTKIFLSSLVAMVIIFTIVRRMRNETSMQEAIIGSIIFVDILTAVVSLFACIWMY